jgi:hypothetical protein
LAAERRREEKTRRREGWTVCVYEEKIAGFGFEVEICILPFVDTARR